MNTVSSKMAAAPPGMPPAKEGYETGAMDDDEPPLRKFHMAVDRHEDRRYSMFLLLATVTTRRKHADACCACS